MKECIHSEHIFEKGKVYTLTTPLHGRHAYAETLNKCVGEKFTYEPTVSEVNGTHISLFKSMNSGIKYEINPMYFLNSDRFKFTVSRIPLSNARALALVFPVTLVNHLEPTKSIQGIVGTIFTKYRKDEETRKYIVTTLTGKEYIIPAYAATIIADKEGVVVDFPALKEPVAIQDSLDTSLLEVTDEPVKDLLGELAFKTPVATVKPKTTYTVKGLEFDTELEAEAAVKMFNYIVSKLM